VLEKLSPNLPSRDIDVTEAFWRRLGFSTVSADAGYLLMKRDGAEVHFWLNRGLVSEANDAGAYRRPSDVDALDAEGGAVGLPATGVPRLARVEDKPRGLRALALVDADGDLIRAGQEPARG
jgi:catechol 2,3-dioxygenase-like lactoylglutathione lyase family enzyme